ncbi:hypothetical protein [uncultured Sphaerochaeta sp.]|uniref:hypothetical protein n=1 Tax=uncultured Sphaerochaeta sp. TaxID=886478 RepID=UPI002A0A47C5|nr:hypothetical protein [uncultured Sphaerochaeta sp.]
MKKTILFLLLILVLLFSGCPLLGNYYEPYDDLTPSVPIKKYLITSSDIFAYGGDVVIRAWVYLPARIYNPNNFSIEVNYSDLVFTINAQETLYLDESILQIEV